MRKITLALVIALCAGMWHGSVSATTDGQPSIRLAILYFNNSGGDDKLEKLRKGLADMLITDLSKLGSVSIVERSRLEDIIKEQELGKHGAIDKQTASRIGKLLGAEAILTGAYFEMMGMLRIDARFIDVETGEVLKSDGVEGPTNDFFILEKELLGKIIANMDVKLTEDEESYLEMNRKEQAISYEDALLFSDALDLMDIGSKQEAQKKLQAVLAKNPQFTPASNALEKLKREDVEKEQTTGDAVVTRGGGDPLKGLNLSQSAGEDIRFGKYYALVIGIDTYSGSWPRLNNAVHDAQAVASTLQSLYSFNTVKTLYNTQATRSAILAQLEWLVNNVTPADNVFIYYSGHGQYKESLKKGYWVPCDASTNAISGYISNSDLQTLIGGIKSKHTLLVSDACFSGDIFRGNTISVPFDQSEKYYRKVHSLTSRGAITSGGIEPVMDGGKDKHSVFAYYFLKALKSNRGKYYDASQLFNDLKIPVVNNSEQSPAYHPIKNTGDEGGQFIFLRKDEK